MESVQKLVPEQLRLSVHERGFEDILGKGMPLQLNNRMTLREGPEAIDAQRLERSYLAVQDALCMCVPQSRGGDPVIRLFAAWPQQWDVEFRLAAPCGFTVSSEIRQGEIQYAEIVSELGQKCVIRNPWPGSEVLLIRDEMPEEPIAGDVFKSSTHVDETILQKKA
jgi:hypothetical protein